MDSVSSVTMGWGSRFASEKLRDFGLSAEGIFVIHLATGILSVGISKHSKNIDGLDSMLSSNELNDVLPPKFKPDDLQMPEIEVKFNYKSKYDEIEFSRQLKNQENYHHKK